MCIRDSPYFFELAESKQLEILYHELISHIAKGIRDEVEAMRDTRALFLTLSAWDSVREGIESFDADVAQKKESFLSPR